MRRRGRALECSTVGKGASECRWPSSVWAERSCLMIRSMRYRHACVLACASMTAGVLTQAQRPTSSPAAAAVAPVASPAGPNSGQPQLTASSRGVILSWVERDGANATLRFAERSATGWSVPRTVASGSNWFVNWADVPSVLRLSNGTLVGHWLQKSGPDNYAYDVRLSYSQDDGRTWSRSFTPHTDGTRTEHGFASLFQMPGAGLGLVWLDGRAMKPQAGHGDHAAGGGAMSVRFAAFDGNWKSVSEAPVDLRVCECCPTTVAVTSDGPIAAFRNRTEDDIRDIHISRLESGKWTEPKAVHNDGWKINACPVNGPMLSARGREVAIAWFSAKDDRGRAFVAFSNDAGRTFSPPIRLDDNGALGRVDLELMPDGAVVASWIELVDQRAQFRARRIDRSGTRSPATTVSDIAGGRTSGYPRIALRGDELIFAWTEGAEGATRVRTAVTRWRAAGPR